MLPLFHESFKGHHVILSTVISSTGIMTTVFQSTVIACKVRFCLQTSCLSSVCLQTSFLKSFCLKTPTLHNVIPSTNILSYVVLFTDILSKVFLFTGLLPKVILFTYILSSVVIKPTSLQLSRQSFCLQTSCLQSCQGTLTEGEGSVELVSFANNFRSAHVYTENINYFVTKQVTLMRSLPYSVSVPWSCNMVSFRVLSSSVDQSADISHLQSLCL